MGRIFESDSFERMVVLLEDIRDILAGRQQGGGGGGGSVAGLRALSRSYLTVETDNLPDDETNADGEVALDPGDTKAVLRHRVSGDGAALLAIGATDQADVEYWLEVNGDVVGGKTNSPLGTVNDPFSYVDTLQGYVPAPAGARIEYKASLAPSGSATTVVGRAHIIDQ